MMVRGCYNAYITARSVGGRAENKADETASRRDVCLRRYFEAVV